MQHKNIISKRGNRSPMLIPKDMPRFQIGLHKVLLDQKAKPKIIQISTTIIYNNVTHSITKTFNNNTYPEKLINLSHRPYGKLCGVNFYVKKETITRYSLSSNGKRKLQTLKKLKSTTNQ